MSNKVETISDKAEKQEAARIIKNNQKEMRTGANGRGSVADGYPLIPVGSAVFLKWNLKGDMKIIGISAQQQKPLNNFWEVIGVGANVKTVNIGDQVILKAKADIESFSTLDLDDIPDTQYHIIYEHAISAILA